MAQLSALELQRWVPVEHLQGDSHQVRFDFTHTVDIDDVDTVVPRDMSGYEFTAQIRPRPGDGRVTANLEADLTSIAEGTVVFELTGSDSANIRAGEYRWDAQWVYAGRPLTFALGTWTVEGQVTR
jgi:hypothetical protein